MIEIGVVVTDLEASMHFYGDLLRLEHIGDLPLPGGEMKRFAHGDAVVKLLRFDDAPSTTSPGGPTAAVAGLRYLTLLVDDVAGTIDACVVAGSPIAIPVFEFEPGVQVGIVEDPDGNWVELVERAT